MKRYSLIKKVITTMSAAVLVFSCGMTAFAAEANLNTDGEQKDIGVYGKEGIFASQRRYDTGGNRRCNAAPEKEQYD